MKHYYFIALIFAIAVFGTAAPAQAQTIIRDTEIEEMMAEWFAPIFKASGKDPSQVDIILVQNNDVNAFVAGGANIFFYTGLLQKTEDPGEVIAVMAHELGHIEGGHLIRAREALENASYESIIGLIVGAAAGLASGDAGATATLSTGASSVAQRRFLSEARKYESGADQAAIKSMTAAGINPSGMQSFLEKLSDQELAPASQQSEYVRTHPLTSDRIEAVRARVRETPLRTQPLPQNWINQHARMKAKLLGYLQPEQVVWVYDDQDPSVEARYARAVAAYRQGEPGKALSLVDALIDAEPENPYFHELKGQMLVDFSRVAEGVPPYKKALELKGDSALIRIALAHALIESPGADKAALEEAIAQLKQAEIKEKRTPRLHRLLATAYGRLGNEPLTKLHQAEEALLQRRLPDAKTHADFAAANLKEGSAGWLRAQDILAFIKQQKG